ncbi:MAG: HAMP domain-containing histidine kinase [Calditrichaeota bacterium]|nr:MAG: HAMP domain-containing protein [Calditrichota bacterium]MBL1207829.1 HAMP domain-containing histidine kinase [Calditrichota bacterium]NOG47663.1 HAMP domain-containing protein [Calditrichota bacterium]
MKIPFKNKLSSRLLAILIISILFSSSIVGYFLYQHFYSFLYGRFNSDLQNYIKLAEQSIDLNKVLQNDQVYLKKSANKWAKLFKCRVTIIDASGVVVADSEVPTNQLSNLDNHLLRVEIQQSLEIEFGSNIRESSTLGQNLLYMAKALSTKNVQIGFLRLAINTDDVDSLLSITRNYFFIAGLLVLLISSFIVIIFSSNINRKLYKIIGKADKISHGDFDTRTEFSQRDELSVLGQTLNDMAAKLSDNLSKLERDKNNLNTVLSSVQDGIVAINPNKEVIFFNKQAVSLLDCSESDIMGKSFFQVIRNQHLNSLLTNFFTKPIFLKDDVFFENRTLDIIITSLKIEDGLGAVIVLRDITHYKMLEKIRKEFVANVSHEFKTPLAVIRGYGETLLDWGLEDKKVSKKYVKKIVKQSNQLENLVSDLLELARIEKLQKLEFSEFKPIPIIKEILNEIMEIADSKNIDLKTSFKKQDFEIIGDGEMFRSIIINLVDNAIKYTQNGGVIKIESHLQKKKAVFTITDSGIGIPLKDQSRIFERFYRVDRGRSRAIGGTGLGLSIVKHLAELQKAEVKLSSEPDKGSSFSIWFDLA